MAHDLDAAHVLAADRPPRAERPEAAVEHEIAAGDEAVLGREKAQQLANGEHAAQRPQRQPQEQERTDRERDTDRHGRVRGTDRTAGHERDRAAREHEQDDRFSDRPAREPHDEEGHGEESPDSARAESDLVPGRSALSDHRRPPSMGTGHQGMRTDPRGFRRGDRSA